MFKALDLVFISSFLMQQQVVGSSDKQVKNGKV